MQLCYYSHESGFIRKSAFFFQTSWTEVTRVLTLVVLQLYLTLTLSLQDEDVVKCESLWGSCEPFSGADGSFTYLLKYYLSIFLQMRNN